jgi:dCTP deaminase
VPDPPSPDTVIDVLRLAPDSGDDRLVLEGPSIAAAFRDRPGEVRGVLRAAGRKHTDYYASRQRLPLHLARQLPGLVASLGSQDRLSVRGSAHSLPLALEVDEEFAWLIGLYVAEGSRRAGQVVWSNTDQGILDRVERQLERLEVPLCREAGKITACSTLLSLVVSWLETGPNARNKKVPAVVFGWPQALLEAFLEGFVDGDDSREATRTSWWTSSPTLVDDLLYLAERVGRRASASFRLRDGRHLYQVSVPHREHKLLTAVPLPSGLLWDTVVEVRDTGETETIFDLEVRPNGRKIENFLAGTGGVFVSNTAGFVDAGWDGHLTLELSNVANLPIAIYPGMKIGQISFLRMTTPADLPYGSKEVGSKYQGQRGPTPSRYYENFREG